MNETTRKQLILDHLRRISGTDHRFEWLRDGIEVSIVRIEDDEIVGGGPNLEAAYDNALELYGDDDVWGD